MSLVTNLFSVPKFFDFLQFSAVKRKALHAFDAATVCQTNCTIQILPSFYNDICRPQNVFFPLIKVSPQFFIKGIFSLKPLILRIYKVYGSYTFHTLL